MKLVSTLYTWARGKKRARVRDFIGTRVVGCKHKAAEGEKSIDCDTADCATQWVFL